MNTPFSSRTNIDTDFHQEKTRITDEAPKNMEIFHRLLSHQDGIKMLTTDRLLLCEVRFESDPLKKDDIIESAPQAEQRQINWNQDINFYAIQRELLTLYHNL